MLDALNDQLRPTGWMVGPKPSTHVSCTIGGMIGNNSCGSTAQAYGKMVDSVRRLEVLTYDGTRMWVGPTGDDEFANDRRRRWPARRALPRPARHRRRATRDDIRARYPRHPAAGVGLQPRFAVAGATAFTWRRRLSAARARWSPCCAPSWPWCAVHRPRAPGGAGLRRHRRRRRRRARGAASTGPPRWRASITAWSSSSTAQHLAEKALRQLPDGNAWLMVQFDGDRPRTTPTRKAQADDRRPARGRDTARDRARRPDPQEGGVGRPARPGSAPPPTPRPAPTPTRAGRTRPSRRTGSATICATSAGCWTATTTEARLAVRALRAGLRAHPHPVRSAHRRGRRPPTAASSNDAAHLVVRYGGSLSGEHGDGQSRGELLPIMFGERVVRAFEKSKPLFDPRNRMNPGKVVHPYRLDEHLRLGARLPAPASRRTDFALSRRRAPVLAALRRGASASASAAAHESGVMCPSYRATGEEEHSTRGRARLLFEMLQRRGDHRRLALHRRARRARSVPGLQGMPERLPGQRRHGHLQGRVPVPPLPAPAAAGGALLDGLDSAVGAVGWRPRPARSTRSTHARGLSTAIKVVGGVDQHRELPRFADERFTRWLRSAIRRTPTLRPAARVVLWPDTFTNNFEPDIARDAVTVLESSRLRRRRAPAHRRAAG